MAAITGEDFNKLGVQISPLDSDNNVQGASYDLRIGDQIWLWSTREISNPENAEVILRRNDIAVIKTYETIKMPSNVCGILINQVAPHAMGVFHPGTSIDPSFEGHMFVALINLGRYDVPLIWKDDLCTAMFFTTTSETKIHFKRSQDFSQLMEVFANKLHLMYPEKPEEVPANVSLADLNQEITWRGNPFLSIYSFLAEQDTRFSGFDSRLSSLRSAVQGYQFIFYMAFPWLLSILLLGVIVNVLSLTWNQLAPVAGVAGIISAIVTITTLVFRWLRGRHL